MSAALAPYRLGTVLLAAVLVSLGLSSGASAGFTSDTTATATVRAAADWTPPTVSLASPGGSIKDTVTLTVTATDAETGVRDVAIQHLPPGGTDWVTICSVSSAPYTCAWDTTTTLDGSHGLRARATDGTGLTSVSASLSTTVANSVLVVLSSAGDVVRGAVALPVTIHNPGSTAWSVRVEYALAGSGSWKNLCPALTAPSSCAWDTTVLANGRYDLRAVARSGATSHVSAVVAGVLVDNAAPSVTMTDPGSPLSGTVTLAASASDAHSTVTRLVIQRAPDGTTSWTDTCTTVTAPYSCRLDTATIPDGSWSFRAIATDGAGNVTISTTVANRVVDSAAASISLADPGAYLTGSVPLTASAASPAGVSVVTIQRAPSGSGSWTDTCVLDRAPYSCTWDTTTVPDALHDLRAVLTDGAGRVTVSAVVAAREVDNGPLRGADVQSANGGATTGLLDSGDSITFTWTRAADLGTVTPGWTGAPVAVTLRLQDGNLLGLGNRGDSLDVQRSGSSVNLGSVNLHEEFIKTNRTAVFDATMTASSVVVSGVVRTTVTVRLGAPTSGVAELRTTTAAAAMTWSPSASVLDELGRPSSTTPVTEPGALDGDF